MSLAWVDGALVERERASVSIDDLGFLYGAGCFETMLAVDGVVFRMEAHWARLERGFTALGIDAPLRATLRAAVEATLTANGLGAGGRGDARIRVTATPGRGVGRPDLRSAQGPTVIVVVEDAPPPPSPARIVVASQRVDPARPLATAKATSYLVSLLALSEARAAGGDEALLLDPAGYVAEAATSNVFVVRGGAVTTPPLASGALPGVTREAVIAAARGAGIEVREAAIARADLDAADEVFVTNSIVGVRAAASVAPWWAAGGSLPGAVTTAVAAAYEALVRAERGTTGAASA
ncbi:MAG: aminotransferase class IV [Dehalococcoidia bacterium]